MSYWQGVAGWAVLLGTTLLTALWLEGRAANRLLGWELLRLGAIDSLLALAAGSTLGDVVVSSGVAYGVVNLVMLVALLRAPRRQSGEEVPVTSVV